MGKEGLVKKAKGQNKKRMDGKLISKKIFKVRKLKSTTNPKKTKEIESSTKKQ